MKEKIIGLISDAIRDSVEELKSGNPCGPFIETYVIYGKEGALDSLGLVRLIADLEARFADEFGVDIILSDDRAMSQVRSPFRTVGSLATYVEKLLKEEENE